MLDRPFAHAVGVVVVHVHGIGAFIEADERLDHVSAAEGNGDLVLPRRSQGGAEHHRGKLLSVADDFDGPPLALKLRQGRGFDKLKSGRVLRRRGRLSDGCDAARHALGARGGAPRQRFVCMTASRSGAKRLRSRLAVEVEAELQLIAFQAEDAEVPVAGLGSFDELDVDFVRLRFDIDVEYAFVIGLGGFGAKAVSIDEQAGVRERTGGYAVSVDF